MCFGWRDPNGLSIFTVTIFPIKLKFFSSITPSYNLIIVFRILFYIISTTTPFATSFDPSNDSNLLSLFNSSSVSFDKIFNSAYVIFKSINFLFVMMAVNKGSDGVKFIIFNDYNRITFFVYTRYVSYSSVFILSIKFLQ